MIGGLAANLLRRHVVHGAEHRAGRGQTGPGRAVRVSLASRGSGHVLVGSQPEIEDLDPPVPCHEQVFRLDVTMDDALVVSAGQTACDLPAELGRFAGANGALGQTLAQCLAFEKFRHDERRTVVRAEVVDREDVGVGQRRDCLGLAFESGEVLGVIGQLARQHLDRNLAIEFGVDCAPDLAHASFADLLDDSVMQ